MTSNDPDLHTLVGAYVLDAVSAEERARFSAHLAGCASCRAEIGELREAAASLGAAEAVRPRSELKEPTIRAAHATGQLAPVLAGPESKQGHSAAGRPRAIRMLAAAAAVIAVAFAVGVGTHYADTAGHPSARPRSFIVAVLSARDAVMHSAPVSTGGVAVVVASRHKHMAVFMARGLRTLPRTRSYELWLMGPRGERPAGRLVVHTSGMAGPTLISGMSAGDMVGLTVEPASGSLKPTTPPVVMIRSQSF